MVHPRVCARVRARVCAHMHPCARMHVCVRARLRVCICLSACAHACDCVQHVWICAPIALSLLVDAMHAVCARPCAVLGAQPPPLPMLPEYMSLLHVLQLVRKNAAHACTVTLVCSVPSSCHLSTLFPVWPLTCQRLGFHRLLGDPMLAAICPLAGGSRHCSASCPLNRRQLSRRPALTCKAPLGPFTFGIMSELRCELLLGFCIGC